MVAILSLALPVVCCLRMEDTGAHSTKDGASSKLERFVAGRRPPSGEVGARDSIEGRYSRRDRRSFGRPVRDQNRIERFDVGLLY
jgi:hypothetical protein